MEKIEDWTDIEDLEDDDIEASMTEIEGLDYLFEDLGVRVEDLGEDIGNLRDWD